MTTTNIKIVDLDRRRWLRENDEHTKLLHRVWANEDRFRKWAEENDKVERFADLHNAVLAFTIVVEDFAFCQGRNYADWVRDFNRTFRDVEEAEKYFRLRVED